MAFHFESKDKARAAIYDAALLLLQADAQLALPIGKQTLKELRLLCRQIEHGYPISKQDC